MGSFVVLVIVVLGAFMAIRPLHPRTTSRKHGLWAMAVPLIFGLVACSDGTGAPNTFVGVGQTSGSTYAVKFVYTTYGTTLFGTYYLRNSSQPSGKAEGTINGDAISMTLANNTSCAFDFGGTITEFRLTGAFVPQESCSIVYFGGTWDLVRQ